MPHKTKKKTRTNTNKKKARRVREKRKTKKMKGGDDDAITIPERVDVAIGMVQTVIYDPTVYNDSTPSSRDGMRLNGLKNLRGLKILSFDNNYTMAVTRWHIGTDVRIGRRMSLSMTENLGENFIIHIRDIYVDYHRFPSEYFMQMITPFLSATGGLVNSLYPHQEAGGNVYIANLNSQVLHLVNARLITSLYDVSFIDADSNPLCQATANIPGLRVLNEGELNKLLTPKFILLTKKVNAINNCKRVNLGDHDTPKKVQKHKP
jgi:hypothetical protein